MGVNVLEGCVVGKGGTMACYDRQSKEFNLFKKEKVSPQSLSEKRLVSLVDKVANTWKANN